METFFRRTEIIIDFFLSFLKNRGDNFLSLLISITFENDSIIFFLKRVREQNFLCGSQIIGERGTKFFMEI